MSDPCEKCGVVDGHRFTCLCEQAEQRGRELEREAVIAFIRAFEPIHEATTWLADSIARGEHEVKK